LQTLSDFPALTTRAGGGAGRAAEGVTAGAGVFGASRRKQTDTDNCDQGSFLSVVHIDPFPIFD
jgi:hypothetical protein